MELVQTFLSVLGQIDIDFTFLKEMKILFISSFKKINRGFLVNYSKLPAAIPAVGSCTGTQTTTCSSNSTVHGGSFTVYDLS